MKDLFSSNSDKYKSFRPIYPDEVVKFICSLTPRHELAWDCGTGNGQLATKLAQVFSQIEATDISEKQLAEVVQSDNIHYSLQPAEKTLFEEHSFDLITVAQAIHWFQFDAFYNEVRRTLKPDGVLAVIGYDLCRVDDETDMLIDDLYKNILGKYWDQERRYIDEKYQTIPFPFDEITCPEFEMIHRWNLEEFIGYLSTWSALKHYTQIHKTNPLVELENQLRAIWKEEIKDVRFKILLRIGRPQ